MATKATTERRKKAEKYGADEVFAVPSLDSYPLTKNHKPDAERVKAAWDYIHVAQNRQALGKDAKRATARIRAFAAQHFPGLALEGGDETQKSWATDEVYTFPAEQVWPLTERRQPSVELVQKAWADIHSARWEARLTDVAMVQAEGRIAAFAAAHQMALQPKRPTGSVAL